MLGILTKHLGKRIRRFIKLAFTQVNQSEVVMRLNEDGIQANRLNILVDGAIVLLELIQCVSVVEVQNLDVVS